MLSEATHAPLARIQVARWNKKEIGCYAIRPSHLNFCNV